MDYSSNDKDSARQEEAKKELVAKDAICVELYQAAAFGDWSTLKRVLDSDPNLLTAPITEWKANVIHVAAASGRNTVFFGELIRYMDEKSVSVAVKDDKEQNALHYAARIGNTEAAKLLVERDPNLTQQKSSFGFSPFQVAMGFGHEETARHLILPLTPSQDPRSTPFQPASSVVNAHQGMDSSTSAKKDDISKPSPEEQRATFKDSAQQQDAIKELILKDTKYVKLYKAASVGDWPTGKNILDSDPDLLTAPITSWKMTVLHMAAASSRGASFLRELLDYMSEKGVPVRAKDDMEQNALHYAARSGNRDAAKLLVETDQTLAGELNKSGFTPLQVAAGFNHTSTISYLMPLTISWYPNIFTGQVGANLLLLLVLDGLYDMAIELLERSPKLAVERDHAKKETALWVLANKPEDFPSGSLLTFWQRGPYQVFDWITEGRDIASLEGGGDVENQSGRSSKSVCNRFLSLGIFRHMRERKLKHEKVLKLLNILIEKTLDCTDLTKVTMLLGLPTHAAAREGIHEFVVAVIKAYPFVISATDYEGRNLFIYAVMHRQHKVFNLFFQLGSWKGLTMGFDKSFNSVLHHAANWSTPARNQIAKIPGAALQMQRELQWYKQVQEVVQPSYKVERNVYKVDDHEERKTPEMLFAESHKELLKEGEEWMKGTANSYTIVAALVVTIAFAAAFTVPGGNNGDTGLPIFLRDISFMVFAIANAFAFFSSATSLLMFLGILTSRYSQEDFLRALPLRLAIGLTSLFFSITSMLVAFTAGIQIMLSDHVSWIVIPAGLLACLSVTLFAFLQGPLLVEVVYSTFGPSIFGQQSNEILI